MSAQIESTYLEYVMKSLQSSVDANEWVCFHYCPYSEAVGAQKATYFYNLVKGKVPEGSICPTSHFYHSLRSVQLGMSVDQLASDFLKHVSADAGEKLIVSIYRYFQNSFFRAIEVAKSYGVISWHESVLIKEYAEHIGFEETGVLDDTIVFLSRHFLRANMERIRYQLASERGEQNPFMLD